MKKLNKKQLEKKLYEKFILDNNIHLTNDKKLIKKVIKYIIDSITGEIL